MIVKGVAGEDTSAMYTLCGPWTLVPTVACAE